MSAFSLLEQIKEPERRKNLFLAFNPLWGSGQWKDQPDSPYRRSQDGICDAAKKKQILITAAAESLGVQPTDVRAGSNIFSRPGAGGGDANRTLGLSLSEEKPAAWLIRRAGVAAAIGERYYPIWEPILKSWESCMILIPGRTSAAGIQTCCDVAAWCVSGDRQSHVSRRIMGAAIFPA